MRLKEARREGRGRGSGGRGWRPRVKGRLSQRPPGRTEEGSAPGAGAFGLSPGPRPARQPRRALCVPFAEHGPVGSVGRETGQTALWRAGVALSRSLGPAAWEED